MPRLAVFVSLAIVLSAATLRAQTVPLVGNHPKIESAQIQGPLDPQKELTLEITFALRNPSALAKLQAEQQQPGSPNYRHWLTPDEFNAQFGPTPEDFKAVSDWLSQQGFTIVESNPAARYIRVSGPVSLVESTFAVHQLSMGDSIFANDRDPQIPARFQNVIASIQGLDNMRAAVALKKKLATSRPITAAHSTTDNLKLAMLKDSGATQSEGIAQPETTHNGVTAFAPNDVYTFYDANPLLNSGITGSGCIAIVGDSNFLASAVAMFNTTFGVPTETVNVVLSSNKNGTYTNPGITSDEPESLLDIEWAHAAAPGTSVNFYLGDNNNTVNGSIFDGIRRAVSDNACPVISVSFGLCGYNDSFYTGTYDPIAAQAAAQGQSILIASDDVGAAAFVLNSKQTECVPGTTRGVNELSADPNVTSVGGSSFNPNYDQNGDDIST
ncbi:MAG TPA: protease pro-enzyme activation domain-containing protein, partial [Candidatus Binataceae bacterium]|nr:protease pro-enzyme activation domain-containing protein [Candidatus Binataceae bacterium]